MKRLRTMVGDMKVRHKIILIYLVVGLIPLIVVALIAYGNINNLVTQRELENYRNLLSLTVTSMDSDIKVYNNLSNYIAYNETIADIVSSDYSNDYDFYKKLTTTLDPMITSASNFHTDINRVTIYTRKDIVAHSTTLMPITEIQHKSWYKKALKSDMPYWVVNTKEHTILNVRLMPTLERKNKLGILVIQLDYDQLFKRFEKLDKYNYGVYVGNEGKVIYAYDNMINDQDQLTFQKAQKLAQSNTQKVITDTSSETPWKVYFYHSSMSLTRAHMQKDFLFLVTILLIMVFVSIMALRGTSKFIVDRIEALTRNAKAIQDGKLEVDVTSEDKDEIGTLIRAFGQMVERIKFLIEEVFESKLNEKNYEMRALQQQINPHFLYNTLSMINFMALESGQNAISKITLSLSDFYRTALNKGNNTCSLGDELKNMNAYLDIQQMMHDYEFELDVFIDDELKDYETPNLILQPIVENAIGHGIDLLEDRKGVLRVYATSTNDEIYIMVEDNGVGMDEETMEKMLSQNSKGYGMRNVNQRIKLLYGEDYGLHIESIIGQGTVVTIHLPKRKFVKKNPS